MKAKAYVIALWVLLWFGVATIWVEGRWAASVLEAGIFGLSAAAMFQRGPIRWHWALGILTAIAAWGVVQRAFHWTLAPAQTEWAILYWLAAACFVGLGLATGRESFLSGLLWFGAAMSALALAQLYTSKGQILWFIPTHEDDRIFGVFPNYNNYAAFIELLFPLALWRTLKSRRNWWIYAAVASVMFGSVIASTSRAGTALVTLELAAVPLLAMRRDAAKQRSGARLLLIVTGVMAFTLVAGPQAVWQRLWQPDPYALRREFLESAMAMVRARPLTGFGLGTWTTAYPAYAVADFGVIANHAHCEWGQWAAEGGLGVVALMAALFVLALRSGIKCVWSIGLTAVMIHACVDYPLVRLGLGSWWFAMLGAAIGRSPKNRDSPQPARE
ncbi:MAG TPA: O-antigen ligase family protein [Bryobacteraceae bacterium]|nr:O-antigen ligase family protein [Bryobacteraceae bacterium]